MKNTNTSKKAEEKQILRNFIHAFPDFPKGKLEEGESPDFILRPTIKDSIGIELTRLYSYSGPEEDLESTVKHKIVQRAKELYQYEHKEPLSVFVCFKDIFTAHLNIPYMAVEINRLIEEDLKNRNPNTFYRSMVQTKTLSEYIKSIIVTHHPEDAVSQWRYNEKKLKPADIFTAINAVLYKKEEKLGLYKKHMLSSNWLILITENIKCAIGSNLNNLFSRLNVNTGFDNIFLFDYFNGVIITIK